MRVDGEMNMCEPGVLCGEAGGRARARQRHHLTGAGEFRRGINGASRGWGYFARLMLARGWFDRAIERAPGDVATSEGRDLLVEVLHAIFHAGTDWLWV